MCVSWRHRMEENCGIWVRNTHHYPCHTWICEEYVDGWYSTFHLIWDCNIIFINRHPCPSVSSVKQANIWGDMTYWWCQYSAGLDMVQPHLTYIVPVRASRYTLITQHNNTYHHHHCSLKIETHNSNIARLPGRVRLKWIKNSPKWIRQICRNSYHHHQIRCYNHVCSKKCFLFCWIFPIRSQL